MDPSYIRQTVQSERTTLGEEWVLRLGEECVMDDGLETWNKGELEESRDRKKENVDWWEGRQGRLRMKHYKNPSFRVEVV